MAITVQELVEQFQQLDAEQQDEALALINRVRQGRDSPFDFAEWSRQIDAFHAQLRAKYGDDFQVNAVELIDQIREDSLE